MWPWGESPDGGPLTRGALPRGLSPFMVNHVGAWVQERQQLAAAVRWHHIALIYNQAGIPRDMNQHRHCAGRLLGLLLFGAPACSANDLVELYEAALAHDASLQSAIYTRDGAIEARPRALSQWLPQLSAIASGTRERIDYTTSQTSGTEASDCVVNPTGNTSRCYATAHGVGLKLTQSLWSYEALSQVKESGYQVAAAEASLLSAEQNLVLRVAQAYFGILSATDQLVTNRNEREAFGSLLSQARSREQTGISARSDVEQAQSFYDATEESVIDAQNALEDANLALAVIVGAQARAIAPLERDIPLTAPDPDSVDEWVASARRGNFDVRVAYLKAQAAAHDISVQRGKGLPTLSLSGSSSRQWQDVILGGNQTLDTISLTFSWPLFQGGAVASAVRQARALHRQTQTDYEAVLRDNERQVRGAFRSVINGISRIKATQRAVTSGQVAMEASKRNLEFGTGGEFDLLSSQNNYYTALRAYNQARYDYLTSALTLKQQAGRLDKRDLMAIDDMLVKR